MKTIMKIIFGSELYGTNSEESDRDIKGIFVPSVPDCFLGNIPNSINSTTGSHNSKNTSEDVDEEYYSIQYFMKLAQKGEMQIIDCIHAPSDKTLEYGHTWNVIRQNRKKFYTKNLKGYVGYVKNQVAKYGFKGTRLANVREVIQALEDIDG